LVYAAQWEPVDQQPAGGTGYDVSIASGEGGTAVYTCVAPAGIDNVPRIYKSSSGGSSWDSVFAYSGMRAVEAYASDPPTVYAGGSSMGVYKSTDGGSSWSACQGSPANVTTIAVAGTSPDIVYVADGRWDVGSKGSVYRTTNGGSSWVDIPPSENDVFVNDIAVNQAHPDSVLVGCSADGQAIPKGIYATTDGGANWTHPYSSYSVYSLAIAPSDPSVAYAGTANNSVLKSTDGGQNWSALQWSAPGRVYSIAVHPDDDGLVYASVSGHGVWRSTNGGESWSDASNGILLTGNTHSRICIDDVHPETLLVGDDHAGFYATTDGGANWLQVSTWMPCRDIRRLATEDSGGYYWTYDNQMVVDVSTNGGGGWTSTLVRGAGDYGDMVHPVADTVLLAGPYGVDQMDAYGVKILRSTDRGYSWGTAFSYQGTNDEIYQFGVAPSAPETVYAATKLGGDPRILRSTNCGAAWTQPEGSTNTYPYSAVAVSPDDPDVVYFGCRNGLVVKSEDGGYSVSYVGQLSGNPIANPIEIRRLVIGVGDMMYAATDSGVYVSCDCGEDWTRSISGMGSNYNIVDLVMDPNGSALWATSYGPASGPHVYVLYNGAAAWQTETDGLPMTANVYSLSFDSDRYLHAGTSVGVFTLDVRAEGQVGADATYPNWSKKLARDADSDILHVVYTGNNTVFYK
jgi:photosystem II stability/assembly factor-like uncharacterized protein